MSFIKRLLRKVLIPIFPELRPKTKRTLTEKFSALREFQLNAPSHQWKHLLYHNELCQLVENVPGDFAEFGVAGGTTFISLARILDVKDAGKSPAETRHVYGFDSFEGLPEDWEGTNTKKGGLSAEQAVPNIPGAEFYKGWFKDTIPKFLSKHPEPFSFLHIDSDIYSSAADVLTLAQDRIIPGTVILFDEIIGYDAWKLHEYKAFNEFAERHNVKYRWLAAVANAGQAACILESRD